MDAESARAKVRKLRALAADRAATPSEADNARRAADRIERKYPAAAGPPVPEGLTEALRTGFVAFFGHSAPTTDRPNPKCPHCRGTGRIVSTTHGMRIDFGVCLFCFPRKKK